MRGIYPCCRRHDQNTQNSTTESLNQFRTSAGDGINNCASAHLCSIEVTFNGNHPTILGTFGPRTDITMPTSFPSVISLWPIPGEPTHTVFHGPYPTQISSGCSAAFSIGSSCWSLFGTDAWTSTRPEVSSCFCYDSAGNYATKSWSDAASRCYSYVQNENLPESDWTTASQWLDNPIFVPGYCDGHFTPTTSWTWTGHGTKTTWGTWGTATGTATSGELETTSSSSVPLSTNPGGPIITTAFSSTSITEFPSTSSTSSASTSSTGSAVSVVAPGAATRLGTKAERRLLWLVFLSLVTNTLAS